MKESTLDYIFATIQIENFITEQINEASDHQILIRESETEMVKKWKLYKISKTKRIPNKEDLEKLINSEWPLEIFKELRKSEKIEQLIRSKLYTKKKICYKINNSQDWEKNMKIDSKFKQWRIYKKTHWITWRKKYKLEELLQQAQPNIKIQKEWCNRKADI